MERLVKLQLVVVCTFQTFQTFTSPLSFGSNLQQATLSTAFTQSNRSCPRCGAAILVTDFFQGQNRMQTRYIRKHWVRGNRALRALGGLKAPRGLRAQGGKP